MKTIVRSGYTAHRRAKTIMVSGSPTRRYQSAKTVRVSPTVIRNVGRPGKGPKILPPMRKGMLTMYGYSTSAPNTVRHTALMRAAMANSPLTILKRLRLVATYTRRSNPRVSRLYLKNRNWVKKTLFHKL
jgi:hypothetical protein